MCLKVLCVLVPFLLRDITHHLGASIYFVYSYKYLSSQSLLCPFKLFPFKEKFSTTHTVIPRICFKLSFIPLTEIKIRGSNVSFLSGVGLDFFSLRHCPGENILVHMKETRSLFENQDILAVSNWVTDECHHSVFLFRCI